MCCGSAPAAPESRDLLAIIHPAHHSQPFQNVNATPKPQRPALAGRLRLSNAGSGYTATSFQHSPSSLPDPFPSPVLHVRIHRFGSPLQEPTSTSDANRDYFSENPVIHTFSIPTTNLVEGDAVGLGLAQSRFDLGVGGEGIIGRTISVADWEGGLLGQGIIGRM